ncbi:MAG: AAA family ATPase [Paracoccaceae bacterium]
MAIISLVTMKGGSGKTTLATSLAGYWLKTGKSVRFIDTDPALTAWRLKQIGKGFNGIEFRRGIQQLEGEVEDSKKSGIERTIIDTPGFETEGLKATIKYSDYILVPVRPSPLDFQVAIDTFALINEVIDKNSKTIVRLVITQSNKNSILAKQMREDMTEASLPVCDTHISARVAFAEAALASSTPSFSQPASKAALEIEKLALEINSQIK